MDRHEQNAVQTARLRWYEVYDKAIREGDSTRQAFIRADNASAWIEAEQAVLRQSGAIAEQEPSINQTIRDR